MTTIPTQMVPIVVPGPSAPSKPYAQNRVVVQVKQHWSNDWQTDLSLIPIGAEVHIRRAGESEFSFKRYYGPSEKAPYETAAGAVTPLDLRGWWVRVLMYGSDAPKNYQASSAQDQGVILFQGRIEGQTLNIGGDSGGRFGVEAWTAIGPEMILRKLEIYQSRQLAADGTSFFTADWMPGFNIRATHEADDDDMVALVGNKTDLFHTENESFVFGGIDTWTNFDMLQYLVRHFIQQTGDDAPQWTIGGQVEALETLSTRVDFGATISADEAIQRIIPSRVGIEYAIRPTEAGFEIVLFTIMPEDGVFRDYVLPKNPDVWSTDIGSDTLIDGYVVVVDSAKKKYDKIKFIGERTRLCFSFGKGRPVSKRIIWNTSLQAEYLEGAGDVTDWEANDIARTAPKFRDVFLTYGVDLDSIALAYPVSATEAAAAAATLASSFAASLFSAVGLDFYAIFGTGPKARVLATQTKVQTNQRRTLPELPLVDGVDYSVAPPTENSPTDGQPSFSRPMAFVYSAVTGQYHPVARLREVGEFADASNIGVEPLKDDWGVHLKCSPNQIFALNRWSGAKITAWVPDPDYESCFDYDDLIFTIAIETDYRLTLEQALPAPLQSGNGMTKVLYSKDAHYWVLTPGTVVGISETGALQESPAANMILRDDTDRMARSMAGAVATYMNSMVNLTGRYKNILPLHLKLGSILRAVEDGGVDTNLWSLVSSITWDFQKNETELATGYAMPLA